MDATAFTTHGALSWCELTTPDLEAAKRFYGELLGWNLEAWDGSMPYTLAKIGNQAVGGLMQRPPEAGDQPSAWGIYITVRDVDATAARVEAMGGTLLVPPTDIPNVGRFATLRDPGGAALSIITYAMAKG